MCIRDRNRTVCLQLWRAGIPLHGRSAAQRYWTSPRGDGKERRGGARWRGAAIKNRRKQKVESRRESCTCGRGDQVAFIIADVSYTHLRAHETVLVLVCRLLLDK